MSRFRLPRILTLAAFVIVAGMVAFAVACSDDETATPATTASPTTTPTAPSTATSTAPAGGGIAVRAGVNDPEDRNIAVLAYLPQSITVNVGTPVQWTATGPEPHSVSFFPPGQTPPAPDDPALATFFAPTPPTGPYDGTTFINSGLGPLGPEPITFDVSFSKAGAFTYVCVIHPTMTGTVTVVDAGAPAETAEEITARGDAELTEWLTEGRAAKAELLAKPLVSVDNPDGSKTWTVEMGITTLHTDVLAFQPVESDISAGDSIIFENNSGAPHTASFPNGMTVSPPGTPGEELPVPGPSPLTLDPAAYLSTGFVPPDAPPGGGPPLAVRQFTVVVPTAGTYAFVCLLHSPSGMEGIVNAQ